MSDISKASGTLSPLFTIATPVTSPQARMPGATGSNSRAPLWNSARQAGSFHERRIP